jgi:hypothetical protein
MRGDCAMEWTLNGRQASLDGAGAFGKRHAQDVAERDISSGAAPGRPRHAVPFRAAQPLLRKRPMSKEQRATKNTKKPKKDAPAPKAFGADRPTPPVTTVAPKGKLKNKPA